MSQQPPPDFNFDTSGGKDNSASKQPEPQSGAEKLLSSLYATAGAAATIVARQTERTKLTTMTIPAAYRALGKDCVQQKRHLESVPELIQQLRSVISELKALSDAAKAQPAAQSLTDKAKAAGNQAADFARQKQLGMKRDALIADIGKAIHDQHGDASGPAELVTPIRDALARIPQLDADIFRLSEVGKGSHLTPKRLLIGGGIATVLLVGVMVMMAGSWMFGGKSSISGGASAPSVPDSGYTSRTNKSPSAFESRPSTTFNDNDPIFMEWNDRLTALRKIRVGMNIEQVEAILGLADEIDDDNDPSGVLAERGVTLSILTWVGDEEGDSILIGFENEQLKDLSQIKVNAGTAADAAQDGTDSRHSRPSGPSTAQVNTSPPARVHTSRPAAEQQALEAIKKLYGKIQYADASPTAAIIGVSFKSQRRVRGSDLGMLKDFPSLQELDLSGTAVTDVSLLLGLSKLRILYLPEITPDQFTKLAELPSLLSLSVGINKPSLESAGIENPYKNRAATKVFESQDFVGQALANLSRSRNLANLRITQGSARWLRNESLAPLQRFPSLVYLEFQSFFSAPSEEPELIVTAFEHIAQCRTLDTLIVPGLMEGECMARLAKSPSLRRLQMATSRNGDAILRTAATIPTLSRLNIRTGGGDYISDGLLLELKRDKPSLIIEMKKADWWDERIAESRR